MRTSLVCLIALLTLSHALIARAAEIRTGDDITIKADETIADDLYIFGKKVTIDGTIEGDVVAFGEQITINGTVKGDVMAIGQTVVLMGTAEGARIAGQVLKLGSKAKLDGDILAAGYSLELEKDSTVTGDALYAGFQALFAGQIDDDLRAALANCRLTGAVGGDVKLEVGGNVGDPPQPIYGPPPPVAVPSVPGGLTVADSAAVEGDLDYQASKEAKIDPMAKITGKVNHRKPAPARPKGDNADAPPRNTALTTALVHVRHFAAVAIVGLVALLVMPRWTTGWAENIRRRPGASFLGGIVGLIGFIALLVVAVIVIIFAAVLLGLATLGELVPMVVIGGIVGYLALIVGFWLLAAFLAQALVGLALGRVAVGGEGLVTRVIALLLGIVIVGLILSIPYAGPWIAFPVFLLGLGGYCLWLIGYGATEHFGPPMQPVHVERPLPARLEKLPPPAPRV